MANNTEQPTIPGLEAPLPPSATFDPSKMRHLGAIAAADEAARAATIAELRGDDLGAEQTGFKPEIVESASAAVNPPKYAAPKANPRRSRGAYGPDRSDDASLEGTTFDEMYPPASSLLETPEQVAERKAAYESPAHDAAIKAAQAAQAASLANANRIKRA